jgi:hypothetical protein
MHPIRFATDQPWHIRDGPALAYAMPMTTSIDFHGQPDGLSRSQLKTL